MRILKYRLETPKYRRELNPGDSLEEVTHPFFWAFSELLEWAHGKGSDVPGMSDMLINNCVIDYPFVYLAVRVMNANEQVLTLELPLLRHFSKLPENRIGGWKWGYFEFSTEYHDRESIPFLRDGMLADADQALANYERQRPYSDRIRLNAVSWQPGMSDRYEFISGIAMPEFAERVVGTWVDV